MKKRSAPIVRMGKIVFHKINTRHFDWRDIYHRLLTLTWPQFFLVILGNYLAINLGFSVLYRLDPTSVDGVSSLSDAFFFSVETFATVGYGHMFPSSLYGHLVATAEIISGLFGTAVITGLIFVRFSRPPARMLFSKCMVISPFDGTPALMLRAANLRHYAMAEAEFRLMFMRYEMTQEGEEQRRFYFLKLQFDRLISFPAAITVRHVIDETSPLHGKSVKDLEDSKSNFIASIVCIDTVIQAPVQSQHHYSYLDVKPGRQFVEIYSDLGANQLVVDYSKLHDTVPVG